MDIISHTTQQEKEILTTLQRSKKLFTSLFFSTTSNREMNDYISHMIMWTLAAEKMTEIIVEGLELDGDDDLIDRFDSKPSYCIGSFVSFPSTSHSVLCYCGRRFTRRFDSRKETWTIPKHQPKGASQNV